MKNKQLGLITMATGVLCQGVVQAESKVSLHYLDYKEGDERINVGDTSLGLKLELGVDYTLDISLGYDAVSGASPTWQVNDTNAQNDYSHPKLDVAREQTDAIVLGYANDISRYRIKRVELEDARQSVVGALTIRNEYRNELTLGLSHSKENDYESNSISAAYLMYLDKYKNRSINFGGAYIADNTLVFNDGYMAPRSTEKLQYINLEAGLTQVLSPQSTIDVKLFYNHDRGYLSNHYLTILRAVDIDNNSLLESDEIFLAADTRPQLRHAAGLKVSGAWQIKPWLTTQMSYRFYMDDWDIHSHTIKKSLAIEPLTNWFITPQVVFYTQTQAVFYRNPNGDNYLFAATGVGSNDVRLGEYNALTLSLSSAYQLTKNWQLELSGTYYDQSNHFSAQWFVAGVSYSF